MAKKAVPAKKPVAKEVPAHPVAERPTPKRRSLTSNNPRPKEDFDFNSHYRSGTHSYKPMDDRTTRHDAPPHNIMRPSWKCIKPLIFRPLPCFDINVQDEDVFAAGRKSARPGHYSDWLRQYSAANYIGSTDDAKITFLLFDPRRTDEYDRLNHPYALLVNSLRKAVKQDESPKLGRRSVRTEQWYVADKKNWFPRPGTLTFVQAAVFQSQLANDQKKQFANLYIAGNKPPRGCADKDITQIIQLKNKAGNALIAAMDAVKPDWKGDAHDLAQFEFPDPTSLADGPFVHVISGDSGSDYVPLRPGSRVEAQVAEEDGSDDVGEEKSPESSDARGYNVFATKDMYYYKQGDRSRLFRAKTSLLEYEDKIFNNTIWWDNLLYVPTAEEAALFIAQVTRDMPDLLLYSWRDHDQYLTDEVQGVLKSRTTHRGADVPMTDEDSEEFDRELERDSRDRRKGRRDEEEEAFDEEVDATSNTGEEVVGEYVDEDDVDTDEEVDTLEDVEDEIGEESPIPGIDEEVEEVISAVADDDSVLAAVEDEYDGEESEEVGGEAGDEGFEDGGQDDDVQEGESDDSEEALDEAPVQQKRRAKQQPAELTSAKKTAEARSSVREQLKRGKPVTAASNTAPSKPAAATKKVAQQPVKTAEKVSRSPVPQRRPAGKPNR